MTTTQQRSLTDVAVRMQQIETDASALVKELGHDASHHADPLLAARGARYGAFIDNASISQALKAQMRACPKWAALDADMKEALEMVAHKISRILAGDPHYDDSWVDIAGYATRVADRLKP